MAEEGSVFRQPRLILHDMHYEIQHQISKVSPGNYQDELKAMEKSLSTITTEYESDLVDSSEQEIRLKIDASTTGKGIKNVLEWAKFIDTIDSTSSEPEYLFRACRHMGKGYPIFAPDRDETFNLECRRAKSIDEFIKDLARHLGKTEKEKETGIKVETYFVSMSPILEWTVHRAGRIWNDHPNENAGLAIFDVKKLRQNSDTAIFHVRDILEYLIQQRQEQLIPQHLQQWARNCDEYVSVGKLPGNGLVRWLEWKELYPSPVTLISSTFVWSYTLAKFREVVSQQELELEDICNRVIEFGKALAGPEDGLILPLVLLILKPGIRFWGFSTRPSEDAIMARIRGLVNDADLQKIAQLKI
ncbi:hypothetical protein V500_05854 [Pseudogymnoascus sp. VKM F-4518 (FW-2643)]|nr:hypothetical protein V500_05854 [Pseudogymnoascus sp. VKM F-4518 (FW-2643)]